ncbi:MAG: sodium:solute symporter family protein [Actinomycetales bacterium]
MTAAALTFALVVAAVSAAGFVATRRPSAGLPSLEDWATGGRTAGAGLTWCLLGGTVFTAYTFVAVPGLVYGAGALGFFALTYTTVLVPIAFVLLPRIRAVWAAHALLTPADFVRARFGSPTLALAVAMTGILATMPYVALQLVGVRASLIAVGLFPTGAAGDLVLTIVFGILALSTFRSGMRAPAVISVFKAVGLFAVMAVVLVVVLHHVGGGEGLMTGVRERLSQPDAVARGAAVVLPAAQRSAYVSLAVGSALALLMYPHVLAAAAVASSTDRLRRACLGLPAWTLLLGAFAALGLAALAADVDVPPGHGELAMPLLVAQTGPSWLTGAVLAVVAVGALVPAAVMSVAVGTTFARNIYVEYLQPTATPKRQEKVARSVSLAVKVAAIAFVLGLQNNEAIDLQLLGGVWVLQTLPAVGVGLFTAWPHRHALLAGWGVGMALGTALVIGGGFRSVVDALPGRDTLPIYAALVALLGNIVVVAVATPLLGWLGNRRGFAELSVPTVLTVGPDEQ